jgi:hypothetical protein
MKIIQVTGGDLFHLALQQLGDASQWNRLVQANPNSPPGGPPLDPVLSGIVTLNIPAANPLLTGGVLVL